MNDDIVRRGYLHHQVSVTSCFRRKKAWNRVFVLLKDGCLYLYDSPRDLQPLHTFPLYASCCLFPQYPKVARSNCLQVETPTASVYLCADSPADIKEWAIRIQKAAIVASGGSIGKLHGHAASTGPAGNLLTPNNKRRPSVAVRSTGVNGPILEFPDLHPAPIDSLVGHSPEAAALVNDAAEASRYEKVLQRFRSVSTITAFTSNLLASMSPGGPYAKARGQAKRRIASEWLRETKEHSNENNRRQTDQKEARPIDNLVASMGTLQLAAESVTLKNGKGTLLVTNTAEYPIAVQVGDHHTQSWLQTTPPFFLKPGGHTTLSFTTGSAATSSSSSSSSSPTAAAIPPLEPPTILPQQIPIVVKPCDATDMESSAPQLLCEGDEGQPTARIGEIIKLEIKDA